MKDMLDARPAPWKAALRSLMLAATVAVVPVLPACAQATSAGPVPGKVLADLHGPDAPGGWDYASVDPATKRLLVARMTGVGTITLDDAHKVGSLAPGQHVHSVLPLPGGRVLYTNGDSNTAVIVDARSGHRIATLGTGVKPDGAVFDPTSDQVLVMDGKDGTITRVDLKPKPHVAGSIKAQPGLEAAALDGKGHLFVNDEDENKIYVAHLATGLVTGSLGLPGCDGPTGLVYKAKQAVLVSACGNGVAKILHTDGSEVASLSIGRHPDAVIDDPAHDRVFIPSGGDGTLSEISLSGTPRVTRVVKTRAGARTGAYDPATERLYLPYGTVIKTKDQAPRLVPGSFGVLILDAH